VVSPIDKWFKLSDVPQFFIVIVVLYLVSLPFEYFLDLLNEYGASAENRHDVTKPSNVTPVLVDAIKLCSSDKANQTDICHKTIKDLERALDSRDLQSQQSMARSALGLLHLNFWQLFFGVCTLGLLIWTLFATRIAASASLKAATAAENTLSETREANGLELRPYFKLLSGKIISEDIDEDKIVEDQYSVKFELFVKNTGKTQAYSIGPIVVLGCSYVIRAKGNKNRWALYSDILVKPNGQKFKIMSPGEKFGLTHNFKLRKTSATGLEDIPFFGNISTIPAGEFNISFSINGYFELQDIVSQSSISSEYRSRKISFEAVEKMGGGQMPMPGKWGRVGVRITDDKYKKKDEHQTISS